MSAVQFVPKAEARPGDCLREVDHGVLDPLLEIVRIDIGPGLFVRDGLGERYMPFTLIEAVIRHVEFRSSR